MTNLKLLIPKLEKENPGMQAGVINSANYRRTVREMIRIARTHKDDLFYMAHWPLGKFYSYVRSLPYRRDIPGIETLVRPKFAIKQNWPHWRDCDDKTILVLSWAMLRGLAWRVVVVGTGDHPHHVYPELKVNGAWLPVDATFGPGAGYKRVSQIGKRLYTEKFREVFV